MGFGFFDINVVIKFKVVLEIFKCFVGFYDFDGILLKIL